MLKAILLLEYLTKQKLILSGYEFNDWNNLQLVDFVENLIIPPEFTEDVKLMIKVLLTSGKRLYF